MQWVWSKTVGKNNECDLAPVGNRSVLRVPRSPLIQLLLTTGKLLRYSSDWGSWGKLLRLGLLGETIAL